VIRTEQSTSHVVLESLSIVACRQNQRTTADSSGCTDNLLLSGCLGAPHQQHAYCEDTQVDSGTVARDIFHFWVDSQLWLLGCQHSSGPVTLSTSSTMQSHIRHHKTRYWMSDVI
jgi:hypothetical protein